MVAAAFAASPWMTGVAEVCADIRARGEASAVTTMSPDFFAGHLTAWGFDTVVASMFPALPFDDVIDPARILTPEHKILVVDDLLQRHALPRSRCIAYADSMSDAPLFRSWRRPSR